MNDMTEGRILPKIFNFAVFVFIGGLLQNLYLIIDSIILGQYVGESAIASVGIANPINFIIIGFLMGIAYGFGVIMAKSFGAGNFEQFRKYFFNSIVLAFGIGIFFTILLSITNTYILKIVNTPNDLFNSTHSFLFALYLGCTATLLYNLFAATLRSIGNSLTPVLFLLFAVIMNAIIAYVLVAILNYGVVGSAVATVFSQGLSAVTCYFYIKKKYPQIKLSKKDWHFDKNYAKDLIVQGVPMGLQFSFTGIGLIVVQNFLNDFGTNYIAGFSIAARIQNIVVYVYVALGTAISTFISQNVGAKKMNRIREGMKLCTIATISLALLGSIIVKLFGKNFVVLFTSTPNEQLTQAVTTYFDMVYWAYIPLALLILYRNALQGYGFAITAMFAGIVELVLRVVVVVFFTASLGYSAICLSDSVTWIITAIILIIEYVVLTKIHKKKYKEYYI